MTYSPDNVGFSLWNMSKRLSTVAGLGRETAELLSEAKRTGDLGGEDLAELTEIATAADALAVQAERAWSDLQEVALDADPALIEPTDCEVVIIKNRGDQPAAANRVREVWRRTTCVSEATNLADRLDAFLVARHQDARHLMGHEFGSQSDS